MAARGRGGSFGPLGLASALADRVNRILKVLLVAHWELAKEEGGRESKRFARVAVLMGLFCVGMAVGLVFLHAAFAWLLIVEMDWHPAAVLAGVGVGDVLFGGIALRMGLKAIEERPVMQDTRDRLGQTVEILRG